MSTKSRSFYEEGSLETVFSKISLRNIFSDNTMLINF
jgi:hypothetical protein